MSDMDEVQRLIARTRANREKLNRHLNDFGESPHPIRSPLRDRNVTSETKSPTKLVRSVTFSKSPPKGAETYSKTTVTEREEKFHKTEHIRFSEIVNGKADKEAIIKSIASKYEEKSNDSKEDEDEEEEHEVTTTTTVTETKVSPTSTSPKRSFSSTSSTVSTGSAPKRSLIKTFLPSSPAPTSSIKSSEPIMTSAHRTFDTYDEEVFGASGRKKRLAALANKFNKYDEEDDIQLKADETSFNQSKNDLNTTKEVDVDEEIANINKSSTKKVSAKDPEFVKSLRAQGFEESESKSKLFYDFNESPLKKAPILSSPTKTAMEPGRPSSPHKPHPMQFISPQVNRAMSPTAKTRRAPSPVKNPVLERPLSPHKTHPLQFVSPQVNKSIGNSPGVHRCSPGKRAASPLRNLPEPPSKPARSWVNEDEEKEESTPRNWRSEATVNVSVTPGGHRTPAPPPPPKPKMDQEPRTDTASRRSMAEKWSLFEKQTTTENTSPAVDPAMLSLSERRALFEKNRSFPKPIARFGDPVTPSMLQKNNHGGQKQSSFGQDVKKTPAPPPPQKQLFANSATPKRVTSPLKNQPSPKRISPDKTNSPKKMALKDSWKSALPNPPSPTNNEKKREMSPVRENYPGVNSLKRIKVSPPKPGQLYPQVMESSSADEEGERPGTSMSGASEAPSLGSVIKRAASAHMHVVEKRSAMPSVSETSIDDEQQHQDTSNNSNDIDDILDEALDVDDDSSFESPSGNYRRKSLSPTRRTSQSPNRRRRSKSGLSPTTSAASWEFTTPSNTTSRKREHDFKTPLVEGVEQSPENALPEVEGEDGSAGLFRTVSFYRRQQPAVNVAPYQKIVRNEKMEPVPEEVEKPKHDTKKQIVKLEEEMLEQKQRMAQASKALSYCVSQGEFEGSSERVEGERLLLESTHKYHAARAECDRLKTQAVTNKGKINVPTSFSTGSISISGLSLPLKPEFLKMIREGADDDMVHYFVVLIKYRSRVIATQMLSTIDGISRSGKLTFPNLINLGELDFDFQINLEVYGLQTRREHLSHDVKYHIRKEKSMFNLTPLKKLKKQDSSPLPRNTNPVNSNTIRRPAFGMVGFAVINIQTLKQRAFTLDKVPEMSPLEGGLEMTLAIHSESRIEQKGFLTMYSDVNGYGDWCRRWTVLQGNFLHFWKYPEDELKMEPCYQINLTSCVTQNVTLAPKEVSSRMNTLMLETKRRTIKGDEDSLIMRVNPKVGLTTIRHLLSADTRDERLAWCDILNEALKNLRAWDPNAFRPRSESQSSTDTATSSTSTEIW